MGIFKFRHQGPANDPDVQLCPLVTLDELVQEQRFPTAKNHINEADDLEILDGDGELALLDDQICSVPYELYELENLKEILSVEAWNLYLTEEERLHLTAFLPDMDHETFKFTILELLNGGNLYFGSPLEMFFHRLKGGFYSLRVAHYREGLKLLQEKRFCHSLMSYHESMAKKFVEMRKAWSNCQPSASVEERVRIWNNTNNRKPVLLVDLNAFPTDEEISSKSDKKVMGRLPQKKLKLMNEEVSLHALAMDWSTTASNRTKAKGVLKVKPCEASSMSKQVVQSLPSESKEPLRRPPKGVLKIKPKASLTSVVESPMAFPVHHDQCSASIFGVHPSKLSPPHFFFPMARQKA
ncbi:hypothetical protein HPP92_017853 [Vanilla planifolia]|uniref:DEUBAD domain-containing protein n=1 Tax=Vanilla planifolia TaxID=51239 RepID=A0A835Q7Q6_VANPL|nr:hypothetical protein HPP92_017853 [Vanilla planifolia]